MKHDQIYLCDPAKFITKAYFDCVVSLRAQTQRIVELVFGPKHQFLDRLSKKGADGFSLNNLRSEPAHGKLTLLNRDDADLVEGRIPEMAQISKEFLMRVTFSLKPEDPLPTWSNSTSPGCLAPSHNHGSFS